MNIFRTFGGASNAPSLTNDKAVLGQMNFAFIDMGQGDCTIISAPDNRVFIIDCGSSGGLDDKIFEKTKKLVRAWAGKNPVTMIMTHPDKDHYNKFLALLGTSKPQVDVGAVYFSRAVSDKSPWGNYKETALMRNIRFFGSPLLVEVTLNKTQHFVKKWLSLFDYKDAIEQDIPDTGYVIASGVAAGKNWSISIIAGNVKTTSRSPSTISNVASLCTLARVEDDKILLTGDSTVETMAYLLENHPTRIEKVDIFQVPHHGSDSSLPTTAFKNKVNPYTLLVSVGFLINGYNLPRNTVLQSWLTCPKLKVIDRVIDSWVAGADGYESYKDLNNLLTGKWSKYKVNRNSSSTFFWLADPDDGVKSGTGFFGFTRDGYFIYREAIKKDLYLTGLLGSWVDE